MCRAFEKSLSTSEESDPGGTRHEHRHPIIHADRSSRHDLSDVEKDKLFRGFMQWLTVHDRDKMGSLVEVDQPPDADLKHRLPIN